jgi:hypothetical protein
MLNYQRVHVLQIPWIRMAKNPMVRPVMTATRVEFLDLAVGRCMQRRLQRFPREFMVQFSYDFMVSTLW